jgi:UDP-glucose 4-epimerase
VRLLLTGGAGFVGSHFADLYAKDNEIVVMDDLSNGSVKNLQAVKKKIKFLRIDISKESAIARQRGRFDGIFHLACHPRSFSFNNPGRDVDVNVRATVHLLELARKTDAKMIFTSNSGIYGDPEYLPMDEKHPINCKTPYDVDKYSSELHMRAYRQQYGIKTVVCRLATVYGPRQRVNEKLGWRPVIATFIQQLIKDKQPTVFGDGEQTRDLIYVKDVAQGLMDAFNSKQAEGETYNLGTGVETSINALLDKVAKALGKPANPVHGPPSVGDLRRMCLAIDKAKRAFNFQINYPLDSALNEYVKWYLSPK